MNKKEIIKLTGGKYSGKKQLFYYGSCGLSKDEAALLASQRKSIRLSILIKTLRKRYCHNPSRTLYWRIEAAKNLMKVTRNYLN